MSVANRPVHRPLSPHLQVYKPQLTSIMSILHRATGIALSVGGFHPPYTALRIASRNAPGEIGFSRHSLPPNVAIRPRVSASP